MDYFNTTKYMVNKSRALRNKFGVFPDIPHCPKGRSLTAELQKEIKNFYLDDEISRVLVGKANCITIRSPNGEKTLEPKRLLLGNLKKLYSFYKEKMD